MKLRILTVALLLTSMFVTGQTKVGSIDSELIVGLMPETKKVLTRLGDYAKRLDSSYQIKSNRIPGESSCFSKIGC